MIIYLSIQFLLLYHYNILKIHIVFIFQGNDLYMILVTMHCIAYKNKNNLFHLKKHIY